MKLRRFTSIAVAFAMIISLMPCVYAAEPEGTLNLGDYVKLGYYNWNDIVWQVVSFDRAEVGNDGTVTVDPTDSVGEYEAGYIPMLMAVNVLTLKKYDAGTDDPSSVEMSESSSHARPSYAAWQSSDRTLYGSNYWGDSNLRNWLNSSAHSGAVEYSCGIDPDYAGEAGFLYDFTPSELDAIIEVTQNTAIDSNNDGNGTAIINLPNTALTMDRENFTRIYGYFQKEATTDKVFIPDIMQVYNACENGLGYLNAEATPMASDEGDYDNTYWLRTPVDNSAANVWTIHAGETVSNESYHADSANIGVRPAIYLSMSDIDYYSGNGSDEDPYTVSMGTYTVTYDAAAVGGNLITEDDQTQFEVAEGVLYNPFEPAWAEPGKDYTNDEGEVIYDFYYWSDDPEKYDAIEVYRIKGDVTFYPVFGHELAVDLSRSTDEVLEEQYAMLYNREETAPYTLPDATLLSAWENEPGWEFAGWTLDPDSADEVLLADDEVALGSDTTYYAVYSRDFDLDFYIDGNTLFESQHYIQYMTIDHGAFPVEVTAPASPIVEDSYFLYWLVGDTHVGAYQTESFDEPQDAYAQFSGEVEGDEFYVYYDYKTNGGTATDAVTETVDAGSGADFSYTAEKSGWKFIGWNTNKNATTGLDSFAVNQDTVLYAIYGKEVTAHFYSGNAGECEDVTNAYYNNAEFVTVEIPDALDIETYMFEGWRQGQSENDYFFSGDDYDLYGDTDFYAVYMREVTITYISKGEEYVNDASYMRYDAQTGPVPAEFVAAPAPESDDDIFFEWNLNSRRGNGYSAGSVISVIEDSTLYALWDSELCIVTYDCETNGGVGVDLPYENMDKGIVGEEPDLSYTAEKDGWEFVGWSIYPNAASGMSGYTLEGDVTLYALFNKTVTATFVSDAGESFERTANMYNSDTSATVRHIETPDGFDGWTFIGWTSDPEGTDVEIEAGKDATISDDVTFYALYTRPLTVRYVLDGVTVDTQIYDQTYHASRGALSVEATASGETDAVAPKYFIEWTANIGGGDVTFAPAETFCVDEDTEVTAVLGENTECDVTYDYTANGGEASDAVNATVAVYEDANLSYTAVRDGWDFVGWNTDSTATEALDELELVEDTTLYAIFKKTLTANFYSRENMAQDVIQTTIYNNETGATIQLPDVAEYDAWTAIGWRVGDSAASGEYTLTDEITDFYGEYRKTVTLTYKNGDVEAASEDGIITYYSGSGSDAATFMVRDFFDSSDGYLGWALGSAQGEKYQSGDELSLSENATLYAVWEEDGIPEYTVTYDYQSNGGDSVSQSGDATLLAGEKADLTRTASRADYEFVGWNTDMFATEGLDELIVNGDVTLYAIYRREVSVEFMAGEDTSVGFAQGYVYNNENAALITVPENAAHDAFIYAPENLEYSRWRFDGWRTDNQSIAPDKRGESFYAAESCRVYPVFKRFAVLSYDMNGCATPVQSSLALQYLNGAGSPQEVVFTLAAAPNRSGYVFLGWQSEGGYYQAMADITVTDNTAVTAAWKAIELPSETVVVTYNYAANGGLAATKNYDTIEAGSEADLTVEAVRSGWDFVGWNTDKNAHEASESFIAEANVTLYAIYKKDVTAEFYSRNNELQATENATLYNKDVRALITAPEAAPYDGWEAAGWRDDKHPLAEKYAPGEIKISSDTVFYAVYKREITVSETNEGVSEETDFIQYYNASGSLQKKTVMLETPQPREGYRLRGWEIDGKTYKSGSPVSVSDNSDIVAMWVAVPDGDYELPTVKTLGASVESETEATLSSDIENNGGLDIIEQGFVYWSKLDLGAKYTVVTDGGSLSIDNLSPGTDYYYYAFAENATGVGKGTIRHFATAAEDSLGAIILSPDYISIEEGSQFAILATLLPASASDRALIWQSSDDAVATVDENGMVTAITAGRAVITATSEADRLSAECMIDVTAAVPALEFDFSEWNMASNTSSFASDGMGFDRDTANNGGNYVMATAYLARWDGAVLEEDDAYPAFISNPASLYKEADSAYHVQNVDWIPMRQDALDNDEVKAALMKYGAVYTMLCIDWNCFDISRTNYYCPNAISSGNHAVTIVGWDDDYPRSNFKTKPSGNGAFICKNSWGTSSGEDGFFYVSYYDRQLGRIDDFAVVKGAETNTNYNKIYQYDPFGAVGSINLGAVGYEANVFPQSGETLANDEILRAVSFYTYDKNTAYDVYIITGYENKKSLTKLYNAAASGVCENAGYHTVVLDNSVTLEKGTRFAVVIRMSVPDSSVKIYCEYPVAGYTSNARANADESYFSTNGSAWGDLTASLANTNFCIKAFTDNGGAALSGKLYSGIDNANRSYESDEVLTIDEAIDKGISVNEGYLDYLDSEGEIKLMTVSDINVSDTNKVFGSIPAITTMGGNDVTFVDGAMLPVRYDLREFGLVSAVRNQGQWGTCWAHSTYASLESNLLRQSKTKNAGASEPDGITLSHEELTMVTGSSLTMAKKITPAGSDSTVIWLSGDPSVATVDTNGTVRAVAPGSATISATSTSSGLCAYCSVVVEEDSTAQSVISLEERLVRRSVGDVFMVAYSVSPVRESHKTPGWISDNENVATVNENGVITTLAEGSADISVISGDGIIHDVVTVIVGSGMNYTVSDIDTDSVSLDEGKLSGTITASIESTAVVDKPATAIAAIYDETGALRGIVSVPVTLVTGGNDVDFDIEIEGLEKGSYTVKCFAWDSVASSVPSSLSSGKVITIE